MIFHRRYAQEEQSNMNHLNVNAPYYAVWKTGSRVRNLAGWLRLGETKVRPCRKLKPFGAQALN